MPLQRAEHQRQRQRPWLNHRNSQWESDALSARVRVDEHLGEIASVLLVGLVREPEDDASERAQRSRRTTCIAIQGGIQALMPRVHDIVELPRPERLCTVESEGLHEIDACPSRDARVQECSEGREEAQEQRRIVDEHNLGCAAHRDAHAARRCCIGWVKCRFDWGAEEADATPGGP